MIKDASWVSKRCVLRTNVVKCARVPVSIAETCLPYWDAYVPVPGSSLSMSAEAAETIAAPPGTIDEEHLIRSVIRLAWPVVVQQVSFSMVQLVDTALVGHLGENSLAGVRLAGQIFWFSQTGMVAVGIGSTAIIARNVGAGEAQLATKTLRNAILMSLAWGTVIGIL